jgi:AcrR family transcriptional regulator
VTRPAQPLDPKREAQLLEAAATAFTEAGYEQASLNQIIAAAGWAKGSFYHYFPDKQRLHDYLVLSLRGRIQKELTPPDLDTVTADSYWPAMTRLFESYTRAVDTNTQGRLLGRMFHHPLASRGPEGQLTLLRQQVTAWIDSAVQRGQQLKLVRRDLQRDLLTRLTMALLATIDRSQLAEANRVPVRPDIAIGLVRRILDQTPQVARSADQQTAFPE